MEKGWVKLHRKMQENYLLRHDKNAFYVFVNLLMLVGQEKGQWAGGRRQLAAILEMNDNTLRSVLERLRNNGMIAIDSKTRYSIITVKNWAIYQNKPNGGQKRRTPNLTPAYKQRSIEDLTPEVTPRRHPDDTQTTPLYKELEEEKEIKGDEKEVKNKSQRASPETVKKARDSLMKKLEARKAAK